jgi:hypothetical protein
MVTSALRKYFYQDESYYKSDKTHKNAWCKGCLEARKCAMIELDALKVRGGLIDAVRSKQEIKKKQVSMKKRFFFLRQQKHVQNLSHCLH